MPGFHTQWKLLPHIGEKIKRQLLKPQRRELIAEQLEARHLLASLSITQLPTVSHTGDGHREVKGGTPSELQAFYSADLTIADGKPGLFPPAKPRWDRSAGSFRMNGPLTFQVTADNPDEIGNPVHVQLTVNFSSQGGTGAKVFDGETELAYDIAYSVQNSSKVQLFSGTAVPDPYYESPTGKLTHLLASKNKVITVLVGVGQSITVDFNVNGDAQSWQGGATGFSRGFLSASIDITAELSAADIEALPIDRDHFGFVEYRVSGPLPDAPKIGLFWSQDTTYESGADPAAAPSQFGKTDATSHKILFDEELKGWDPKYKYLLLVVDPFNDIAEADESNNWKEIEVLAPPEISLTTFPPEPKKSGSTSSEPYSLNLTIENRSLIEDGFNIRVTADTNPSGTLPPNYSHTPATVTDTLFILPGYNAGDSRESFKIGLPLVTATDTWDWINPRSPLFADYLTNSAQNTAVAMLGLLATHLKKKPLTILATTAEIADTAFDINEIIGATNLEDIKTHPSHRLRYKVDVVANSGAGPDAPIDVPVTVTVPFFRQAALSAFGAAWAAGKSNLELAFLAKASPAAPILLQTSVDEFLAAQKFYETAKDPPDPNFEEIFTPEIVDPGTIPSGSAEIFRHIALGKMQVSALQEAMRISIDRADGARLADENEWVARQLSAASTYASLSATAEMRVGVLQNMLAGFFDSGSGITQEDLDALEEEGFTDQEIAIFMEAGLSAADIEDVRQTLIAAGPVANSERGEFSLFARAASILSSASSMDLIEDAIQVRVNVLEESVAPVDEETLFEFDDRLLDIFEEVKANQLSASVFHRLEAVINEIHQTIDSTNNFETLKPYLDRAYIALASIQAFDLTPAGLSQSIDEFVVAGSLTEEAADSLRNSVNILEQQLAAGSFDEAPSTIVNLMGQIESEWDTGIPFDTASVLHGQLSFLHDLFAHGELQLGPQANADTAFMQVEESLAIDVLANDVEAGGDGEIIFVSQPSFGSVSLDDAGTPTDTSDDVLVYTPGPDFVDFDGFKYAIRTSESLEVVSAPVQIYRSIPLNEVVNLELQPGSSQTVVFQGTAGQVLYYDILEDDFESVFIDLVAPSENSVFEFSQDFSPFTLPETGIYQLQFHSSEFDIADATFRLIDLGLQPLLVPGQPVSGVASPAPSGAPDSPALFFRFEAQAGERRIVDLLTDSDVYWQMIQLGDEFPRRFFGDTVVDLETDGIHYLRLGTFSDSDVPFEFKLETPPTSVASINFGEVVQGEFTTLGELKTFEFSGVANDRIFFDALDDDFDGVTWRLRGPDGTIVQDSFSQPFNNESANFDSFQLVTLPTSGTYQLQLQSDEENGDFAFRLLSISNQPPLELDTPTTVTLNGGQESIGFETLLLPFSGNQESLAIFLSEQVDALTEFGPEWHLFAPSGFTTASFPLTDSFVGRFMEDGEFVLAISSGTAETVEFSFKALSQAPSTIAAIGLDEPVSGTLSAPLEHHTFTFNATAGKPLYFDSQDYDGSEQDVTIVEVRAPSGQILMATTADDDEPFVTTEDGEYQIVVHGRDDNGTGDYAFVLSDLSARAELISIDATASGELVAQQGSAAFRLPASAGQRLVFNAGAQASSGILWTLYGPDGVRVSRRQEASKSFAATVPLDGDYFLLLENAANGTATYDFIVNEAPESIPAIAFGQIISDQLDEFGERHIYSFSATAGQLVYLDALDFDDENLIAALRTPSGELLLEEFSVRDDVGPLVLPESGEYRLEVYGFVGATGDYGFQLVDLASALLLDVGVPVSGVVGSAAGQDTPGSDLEFFRFELNAGQRLILDWSDDSGSGTWTMYDSAGAFIASRALGEDQIIESDDDSIRYLVLEAFDPVFEGPTEIAFEFVLNEPIVETFPLTFSAPISGGLDTIAEQDRYLFSGQAGQRYFIDVLESPGFSGPSADFRLVSPSGTTILEASADFDAGPDTLPESGEYILTVEGQQGANYGFRVLDIAELPVLKSGEELQGTVGETQEAILFRFSGQSGQTITIEDLGSDEFEGAWSIVAPDNELIAFEAFGQSTSIELESTGVYVLLLEDFGSPAAFSILPTLSTPGLAFRNAQNVMDVTGDGKVFPDDALLILAFLKINGIVAPDGNAPPYLDTTSPDNLITPADAAAVLSYMAVHGFEGESFVAKGSNSPTTAISFSTPVPKMFDVSSIQYALADDERHSLRASQQQPADRSTWFRPVRDHLEPQTLNFLASSRREALAHENASEERGRAVSDLLQEWDELRQSDWLEQILIEE